MDKDALAAIVCNIKANRSMEKPKGPKLIDPPELDLPMGKRRERARRQHNAVRPYRNPKSYIPRKTKRLGLDRYRNRPHRSDRPFGCFEGYDEHDGFNHFDRCEQEWSERERKRVKEEEMESGSGTQVNRDDFPQFKDLCASPKIIEEECKDTDSSAFELQWPLDMSRLKVKQEDDTHSEKNISLPKFEAIFDYSVMDMNMNTELDVGDSKRKFEDVYDEHGKPQITD